ncbi:lipid-A-disaccharide synthase [Pararhizobium sp. YC-54]|uniref:lipid-A-disaccharide synthase n=1 Tax=Pararhizobium sp. YC-54 TaxID=2986920 RepID=UPI0021F6A014|nr:lipid-A-disaccharide synthase [Pararhizobium sp. YC-54]MCV9997164.1 lipid-A-disaccharide synthase [Pararhizobium sp. YC-54]
MSANGLTLAVVAGEVSGDLLGADLVKSLRPLVKGNLSLVGVGGEGLEAEGLKSLFDYSELSIMGISQVLARLPKLILRIRQTAKAIIAAKPDILVIIDSPDFTHRVARIVRKALPDLPIVNYVCPSVWAWKPERAVRMRPYVDHVLAVLPFEPEVMQQLGGPPTTYVGHRLASDINVLAVRARQLEKRRGDTDTATCLLLPGSRGSEISRLLPAFGGTAEELRARHPNMRFLLPTVPRQEKLVREITASWTITPEITVGAAAKWQAFAKADAAIAASGTVILELALAGIPVVSTYSADWIIRLMHKRIKIWTAAIPNLVADYAVVPEYLNEAIRAGALSRWVERLTGATPERDAMLAGFRTVAERMATERPPGETAAQTVLDVLNTKKPGHF